MAVTSKAVRAAALNDAYTSPFAFAEMDLSNARHTASTAPLAYAANDNRDGETAVASWNLSCGCGCGKAWTSFFRDGIGDRERTVGVDTVTNPLLVDDVGGDSTGAAQPIAVGATVYGVIEDFNDQDFFSVTLVAGQTYAISQLLHVGGTATGDGTLLSGVPLADAFIELYGPDGMTLLASADGGSNTTPSGLDAKLFFTATESGTYFINARSFDQDPTNGTDGDHVGDYTLNVREVAASEAPLPRFYSTAGQAPNALLDSLDWGSTWDHTVRNPDGNNGTRTDNGVANGGSPITNTEYGVVGKNVMKFYFAKQGDVFLSDDPANPGLETTLQAREMLQWEKDAFLATMDIYEQVTDLQYIEVDNRADADIKIIIYQGTPGAGASLLGRMSPPGEQNEGQTEINAGDYRWTEEGVRPGGFFFPTLLHEWGHGHGMKHPHDNGGGGPVMEGAGPSDDPVEGAIGGAFGDFGLSQQIYTVMSYNDGWNETGGPGGRPVGHGGPSSGGLEMQADHFGWMGTLGALDIALLQDKYGVNEEWATGNDIYTIADTNQAGNYYRAIWDGGGTDEIRYAGARNANIDLRAATLEYEEGGGGRVSFAMGAWTGFTIANGVTIENATGGDGNDALTGNAADNLLTGGRGNDAIVGGGGMDTLGFAGATAGVSVRLASNVVLNDGTGGTDSVSGVENVNGTDFVDSLFGDGVGNVLSGGLGRDTLLGLGGNDTLWGGAGEANEVYGGLGDDRFIVESAGDTIVENAGEGTDTVETNLGGFTLKANIENMIYTGSGNFAGIGNASDNVITGGAGADTLTGDGGNDTLNGGAGSDLALLSGVRANYTVVAGASPGQYQITDSVAGRDGVDQLNGIERVRFSDGTTALLSDLVAPAAAPTVSANKSAGDAEVLPGISDDDFLIGKGDDMPWVLPVVEDNAFNLVRSDEPGLRDSDTMLTLFQNDDYMMPTPEGYGRGIDGHHDWM